MTTIRINVAGQALTAQLDDTPPARELLDQLPFPERSPPQVAHGHVEGGGEQAQGDAENHFANQPGRDPRHLFGSVGLHLLGEPGTVPTGRPRELENVDVLRGDVHAERQPVQMREDPIAQRRLRRQARTREQGPLDPERQALQRGAIREGVQQGGRPGQRQRHAQHPAGHTSKQDG